MMKQARCRRWTCGWESGQRRSTISYLKSRVSISRLALAVVTGILQSLVDATPQHLGNTFLRNVYNSMHADETLPPYNPYFFYIMTTLSPDGWKDLEWWYEALHLDICATARSRDACTLSVNWVDGSDTGTGGTSQWYEATGPVPEMDM